MEQNNNIEKQIREKLHAREIQPSAQAWDRLDAMLSVAEEKKAKRSFGWLYIAASVLVFASLGLFFYHQPDGKTTTNEVVVHDTIANPKTINTSTPEDKIKEITTPINTTSTVAQTEENSNHPKSNANKTNQNAISNPNQTIISQKTNHLNANQPEAQVAVNTPKREDLNPKSEKEKQILSPKTMTPNPDTAAIASNEKTPASKVKVDANSLLSEVDGELELSFRERMLKKVTKNVKEVKVALSNRNLQ